MRMTAAGKFGGTARAWRPELAVIVSTFERPQHLRRCLESIAAQTEVAERIEVIITDDGSSDLTRLLDRKARTRPTRIRKL
jgi:glycosyltransferase involved in cell wall biosynthesis